MDGRMPPLLEVDRRPGPGRSTIGGSEVTLFRRTLRRIRRAHRRSLEKPAFQFLRELAHVAQPPPRLHAQE